MKFLSQVNKYTFEELEIPDEVMDQLYQEWYQRSLDEMDAERFDLSQLIKKKSFN